MAALGNSDIKRIDTASAGIRATVGSQSYSVITNTTGGATTQRVNTNLFQPYHASTQAGLAQLAPAWGTAIGNTWTPGASYNFKCMLVYVTTTIFISNPNTSTAILSLITCKARKNQFGPQVNPNYDDPEELLFRGWNQQITVGTTLASVYTSSQNVRQDITVYDSPLFTQQWKVVKTKTWTLKPGAHKKVKLPFKRMKVWKMADYYYGTLSMEQPTWNYLRGDYLYLWRLRGEDGAASLATATTDYIFPSTANTQVNMRLIRKASVSSLPNPWTTTRQNEYNWAKDATGTGSIGTTYSASTQAMVTGRTGPAGALTAINDGGPPGVWKAAFVS